MTAATIFSGGGGADIGLSVAGLDVQWGIEYDDEIASVARHNGLPIYTGDVTEVDPPSGVDFLHASPPCPNFSVAKTGAKESDEDVSLARATARFIRDTDPDLFTLENVWGYRKSQSWKLIREDLQRSGYDWNAWKLNAADYGVPQTRKRMIVAARKGGPRPKKPTPTHAENPQSGGFFGDEKEKWVGWYEAIQDLIGDLPKTELADWQKERLPEEITDDLLLGMNDSGFDRAEKGKGCCEPADPMNTVAAEPTGGGYRALLVPGGNATSFVTHDDGQRVRTISNTERVGNRDRAVLHRRIVQMTPRCLARFQTFPDWYELPNSKSLACRIIGNAVPPLAMKKWVQHWAP